MCRLMAYVGQPQLLADIVLYPDRSIIKQSYDARERKIDPTLPFHLGHGNLNGDGFGIGWFNPDERRVQDPTPCVFTSITPAWNNENLSRLACKIVSPLVFAHVRAAYPGMPVSEQNCHPFQFSRYMWMHNGVVGGFAQIRRSLLETLSDCAYNAVASFHSDSAVSFALFLNHLPDVRSQQPPDVLIKAMQDTIATISAVQRRHGITATSLLNYVVSDGTTLIATRFVSPDSEGPASLYYAEGATFARAPPPPVPQPAPQQTQGQPGCTPCNGAASSGSSITQESSYELSFAAQGPAVVFVASEPITASASDWVAVPKNTALVVTREKGGFLNILRCPLVPQHPPLPSPTSTYLSPLPGNGTPPLPRRSSGGGGGTGGGGMTGLLVTIPSSGSGGAGGGLPYINPQRDVGLCLEALSRGLGTKSRAFLSHRPTGMGVAAGPQQHQPGGLLPVAPESLAALDLPPSGTSMVFSRPSLGGVEGLPATASMAQLPPAPGTATATPAASMMMSSRAGSQGLEVALASPALDTHDYMRLVGHTGAVLALTVCPYTARLYTSSVDCSVRVWSLRDNSCLHTLVGQRKPVTVMRLRAHGRLLLAASGRKIRVWDAVGFRCLQVIKISDSCGTIRCMEVLGGAQHHHRHHSHSHHSHQPGAAGASQPQQPRAHANATSSHAAGPPHPQHQRGMHHLYPQLATAPAQQPAAGRVVRVDSRSTASSDPAAAGVVLAGTSPPGLPAEATAMAAAGTAAAAAGSARSSITGSEMSGPLGLAMGGGYGSFSGGDGYMSAGEGGSSSVSLAEGTMGSLQDLVLDGFGSVTPAVIAGSLSLRNEALLAGIATSAGRAAGASNGALGVSGGPGAAAPGGARAAAAVAAAALMAAGGGAASAAAAEGLSLLYVGCQDTTVKVFTLNEPQLLSAAAAAAVEAVNAAANAARAAGSVAASRSDSLNNGGLASPPSKPPPPPPATTTPVSPFAPAARGTGGLAQALSRTTTTGVSGPPAVLPPRLIATPEEAEHGVSDLAPLMVTAADGGAHVGPVNCLAVCGRYLCSGGGDATVRVWDAATLKLVAVLRGHRGSVLCLLGLGPNLLLSGARDNTIRVWDLEMDMLCRRTLTGHKDDVTGLSAISLHKQRPGSLAHAHSHPHGQHQAQGHTHVNGAVAGTPPGRGGGVPPVAAAAPSGTLTPGGRSVALASTVIASSSADGTVRLWSTAWACLCILSLPSTSRPVMPAALCGCLTPDMAMAGYGDGEVRLWHIEDVHGAVLQRCYNEVAAAAEALQAAAGACGCLSHGAAEAGTARDQQLVAALAQVQQFGAAGAVAAAAALSSSSGEVLRRCSNAGSAPSGNGTPAGSVVQGTLALLGGGGAAADSLPAVPVSEGDVPSLSGAPPAVPDPTAAAPPAAASSGAVASAAIPKSSMLTSPSLAHLVGDQASNRPDSRASDASGASGPVTDRPSSVDLMPTTSTALGMQRVSSSGLSGGGAAPSTTACAMAASVMAGPGTAFATPLPHAGAMPTSAVPIHIHGRRSPLSGASAANLGANLSEGPGASAAAGCAAAATATAGAAALPAVAAAPLPVPPLMSLPGAAPAAAAGSGAAGAAAATVAAEAAAAAAAASTAATLLGTAASYFTSTSDQQLEAALREFVRIKTVSSSPRLRDDCHKGAKFVAKMLEGLGADVKVVQVYEDKNPVVIGRLGHNPDRPTVTFYGHYDVQPAAEPDWATNPFELNSVNEYLYGRGVSDNKGPILAFIFAVRELMNAAAEAGAPGGTLLPVNVAFVFEGEEENGSRGFAQAITQNLRWFEGTQLIIISNTLWVGENVPCLTYGMRGMLSLTVQITGPERDLHSGNDGGVFAEPMVDLLRVMATLVGPGGRVQVPGFYEEVEPDLIELAWTSLEHSEEFSLEGYKAALGVPSLTAPPHKRDLLVTRWCLPSLSVVDMRPGAAHAAEPATTSYRFGPTRFSVIPKAAQGKVSVRFVPNQDADTLVEKLRQHVHKSFEALGSSNRIDLHVEARGNWWEVRRQGSPWLDMAEKAIAKEWGVHPLYVREGGTMPVASHLERLLCAPAIMIPMGQSSDNCHLANERIRRTNLFKGKNVIRRLLEEIGAMGGGAAAAAAAAAAGAAAVEAAAGARVGSPCGGAATAPVGAGEAAVGSLGDGPEASLGSLAATAEVVDNGESWGAPTACAGLDE